MRTARGSGLSEFVRPFRDTWVYLRRLQWPRAILSFLGVAGFGAGLTLLTLVTPKGWGVLVWVAGGSLALVGYAVLISEVVQQSAARLETAENALADAKAREHEVLQGRLRGLLAYLAGIRERQDWERGDARRELADRALQTIVEDVGPGALAVLYVRTGEIDSASMGSQLRPLTGWGYGAGTLAQLHRNLESAGVVQMANEAVDGGRPVERSNVALETAPAPGLWFYAHPVASQDFEYGAVVVGARSVISRSAQWLIAVLSFLLAAGLAQPER